MVTISVIESLKDLVRSIINEQPSGLSLSETEYRDELERIFNNGTRQISEDLERDFYLASSEECKSAEMRFRTNMTLVTKKAKELEALIGSTNDTPLVEAQIEFCRKLSAYIRTLINKTEELSTVVLTKEEIDNTFYVSLLQPQENLAAIYENLVREKWIDEDYTSESDFEYYFGGTGVRPSRLIGWKKSLSCLGAFIDLMTDDRKFLAKAPRVFAIQAEGGYKPVSVSSLKQSRHRGMEVDAYWDYKNDIKEKILPQ